MSRKGGYGDLGKDFRQKSPMMRNRAPIPDRAHLSRYRVIQRDLVYVIGIPTEIADEELLSQYEYFGQYGPIKKIAVNKQASHIDGQPRPTVSAYVTFANPTDAGECIYALENFVCRGYQIKASFGTSKYCSSYLSGQKCGNPNCMYLHYTGDSEDSFAMEEIQQNSPRFTELTRPARPPDYYDYPFQDSRPAEFPPRRILNRQKKEPVATPVKSDAIAPADEPRKKTRSEFLAALWNNGATTTEPLRVDYVVGKSLKDLFALEQPTIRSMYSASLQKK